MIPNEVLSEINGASYTIEGIEKRRQDITGGYDPQPAKDIRLKVLNLEKEARISAAISRIEKIMADHVKEAKTKAEPYLGTPEKRQMEALIAHQDLEFADPDQMVEMYQAACDEGNDIRKNELRRLISNRMAKLSYETSAVWAIVLRKNMDADEVVYILAQAESKSVLGSLQAIAGTLSELAWSESADWPKIVQEMQDNANRQAGIA